MDLFSTSVETGVHRFDTPKKAWRIPVQLNTKVEGFILAAALWIDQCTDAQQFIIWTTLNRFSQRLGTSNPLFLPPHLSPSQVQSHHPQN